MNEAETRAEHIDPAFDARRCRCSIEPFPANFDMSLPSTHFRVVSKLLINFDIFG